MSAETLPQSPVVLSLRLPFGDTVEVFLLIVSQSLELTLSQVPFLIECHPSWDGLHQLLSLGSRRYYFPTKDNIPEIIAICVGFLVLQAKVQIPVKVTLVLYLSNPKT